MLLLCRAAYTLTIDERYDPGSDHQNTTQKLSVGFRWSFAMYSRPDGILIDDSPIYGSLSWICVETGHTVGYHEVSVASHLKRDLLDITKVRGKDR